jgi:hypothetical protein
LQRVVCMLLRMLVALGSVRMWLCTSGVQGECEERGATPCDAACGVRSAASTGRRYSRRMLPLSRWCRMWVCAARGLTRLLIVVCRC